jgi:ATP-binding cassette, subfamily G (WHITE), member 2, PDR
LIAFLFFFMAIYFVAVELNSSTTSTAEVLVFRRGHVPDYIKNSAKRASDDEELAAPEAATKEGADADNTNVIPPQKDIFTWRDVSYEIPVKGGTRMLLDNVSGWVKPGTLTALVGPLEWE